MINTAGITMWCSSLKGLVDGMARFQVIFCLIYVSVIVNADQLNNKPFPEDFMFGVASSSYQIEGAWNEDGKGVSIWDQYLHDQPSVVADGTNGDVACDSYHKWEEDVQILKDLGVNHYRFSLSWSRLFPKGLTNKVNEAGVTYYRNLINALRENNIEPLVTLYHWDLPQDIQDVGGLASSDFPGYFVEYARSCFELFGDSVTYWTTFNEPPSICIRSLFPGSPNLAPPNNLSGTWDYLCGHNLLKAHARAFHLYDSHFRPTQNGTISIVINADWFQPASDSVEDQEAAETLLQFMYGWFANPLFNGDYPEVMKHNIGVRSAKQGYKKSRLPEFTKNEIEYLKGTVDLLGVNVYTAALARPASTVNDTAENWLADAGAEFYQPADWPGSASDWLKVTPWSLGNLTLWIKDRFGSPKMLVTENGWSDNGTTLEDDTRIYYIRNYLSSLRDAMDKGADVKGYTYWSIMDNFEWLNGIGQKFGLYHVDFDSANRTRTAKKSVEYYKQVVATKCIADCCICKKTREP